MALSIIEYNETVIYYNDWKNITNVEEFKLKIEEGNENTRNLISNGESDILTLTDITSSFVFSDINKLLRESAKLAKPITKKSAAVGLSATKRITLNGLNLFANTNVKAFDTIEEAKKWLVTD